MPSTATDRLAGISTSVAVKPPCKVAAISNITLSGAQTVNGVAVVDGDRVLVTAQTSSVDNGIYVVDGSAAWARAKDFDGTRDVVDGTLVLVGTTAATSQFWLAYGDTDPIVPGTSAITFEQVDYQELALRSDLASTASASLGDALIGVKSTRTGGAARTQHSKNSDFVSVLDFGANTTPGTTDMTAIIQAAIDSFPSGNGTIYFPPGVYLVTGTVNIQQHRIHLIGAGRYSTEIRFAPTANDICFSFARASTGILYQCSLRGMTIYSSDSTYVKTAIESVTTSQFVLDDVVVGGSVVAIPGSTFWSDATNASVGLRIRGHEQGTVRNFMAFADRPIQISKNPNDGGNPATVIDIDHWCFTNTHLGAVGPCITVDTGINLTSVTFDGYQAWVLGTHGFYWSDTTTTQASLNLRFENVRTEQGTDATAWCFYIAHNHGLQSLQFVNFYGGLDRKGWYLRGIDGVEFDSTSYVGTLLALDADATVDRMFGRNTFWQAGSTKTLAGQRPVLMGPSDPSTGALPPTFEYSQSSNNNRTLRTGLSLFGSNDLNGAAPISMAADAVEIVASSNACGRLFLSTQEGVSGVFNLNGTNHTTTERDDAAGFFTNTKDSALAWNVYWDSGLDSYVVQNKRGSTQRIGWLLIGSDTAI